MNFLLNNKRSAWNATRCNRNFDCLWQSASGAQSGASPSKIEGVGKLEAALSALFLKFLYKSCEFRGFGLYNQYKLEYDYVKNNHEKGGSLSCIRSLYRHITKRVKKWSIS